MDRLGISRREANERVKAAQLDDDVEPDDSAGSLTPDTAGDAAAESAAQAEKPTAEELAEQERQRRLREENKRAAEEATGKGQLNAQDRAAIYNELSRLLPGGSMTAEEIKRKVYQQVGSLNSAEIRRLTRQLVDQSNRTVSKAKDRNADYRRRNLFVGKQDADGCITISGTLDAAAATLATKLFNDYAIRGQGIELPEGVEDKRTLGQKYADALTKILQNAMAHANNGRPGNKGLASIVATADAKDFCLDPNGEEDPSAIWWRRRFHTNVGTSLNAVQMLRLGVTDNMLLALFDTSNGLAPIDLDLYKGRRLASFEQRIAAQIIDGCCQHPGCDRAIDLCDLHHILPFIDGGETTLENLVPMCRAHHRQNDDTWQADYRGHMCERTAETNFRSGHVRTDGNGRQSEPRFNTGPAAQQAPGYVPPPGGTAEEPPEETSTRAPEEPPPGTPLGDPPPDTDPLF